MSARCVIICKPAQLGISQSADLPTPNATGALSHNEANADVNKIGGVTSYNQQSLGPSLSYLLYDFGARSASIEDARVTGVLAAKGQSLDGRDRDDTILIPATTAQRKPFGTQFACSVRFMMAEAISAQAMPAAERAMNELLRQRHHLRKGANDNFSIGNSTALANAAAAAARVMSLMLWAIASISLVVGGIGIMNIMRVSVMERTREIGMRMAVGARRRVVLLQFLLEAIIISIAGCLAAVHLGVDGAIGINAVADTAVVITLSSIRLALVAAGGRYIPAYKAAHIKPIEALRCQ